VNTEQLFTFFKVEGLRFVLVYVADVSVLKFVTICELEFQGSDSGIIVKDTDLSHVPKLEDLKHIAVTHRAADQGHSTRLTVGN
jgi:hypothetical protein